MPNTATIVVSDHALVRFIERHFNIDLSSVRQEIARLADGPAKAGATSFQFEDGTFCFKRDKGSKSVTVATFLAPGQRTFSRKKRGKSTRNEGTAHA